MSREPLEVRPMADRVMVIIGEHKSTTFYELEPIVAELLMLDLKRAVESARAWADQQ